MHIVRSEPLLEDADAWARTISPTEVLQQIGSPFADANLIHDQPLSRAARSARRDLAARQSRSPRGPTRQEQGKSRLNEQMHDAHD